MKQERVTIRDTDAGDSLEILLITAIATILSIRVYLHLTNYPQIGGGTLHIAHMLWGGLSMLVALVILLTFWNPSLRRMAAVFAGIGWGTFIDELGKFITKDNDYFFQPTFAVLYILFMVMFFIFRSLTHISSFSAHELEVNQQLRVHLRTADDAHGLSGRIGKLVLTGRQRIEKSYAWLVAQHWFNFMLIGVFLAVGLSDLGRTVWNLTAGAPREQDISRYEIFATLASNGCVWIGILYLRRSRLQAMRWFQRSLLVIMLLSTPLHFYRDQLSAFVGFLGTATIYLLLRYAIRLEEGAALKTATGDAGAEPA